MIKCESAEAKRMVRNTAIATGVVTASLSAHGTVLTNFTPDNSATAMRPMRAKNLGEVLSDQLIRWCCIDRLSWQALSYR